MYLPKICVDHISPIHSGTLVRLGHWCLAASLCRRCCPAGGRSTMASMRPPILRTIDLMKQEWKKKSNQNAFFFSAKKSRFLCLQMSNVMTLVAGFFIMAPIFLGTIHWRRRLDLGGKGVPMCRCLPMLGGRSFRVTDVSNFWNYQETNFNS